MVSTKFLLYSL